MPKYMCWDPERSDEGDGLLIVAGSAARAAEGFSAKRDALDVEYPQSRAVHVRSSEGVEVFEVELRSEPVYTARKARKAG